MQLSDSVSPRDLENLITRNIESMAFEPSEFEAVTYAELVAFRRVVVTRPPAQDLVAAGFVHYDCHRNCGEQAENDLSGKSQHVVGWMPHDEDLILHSVAVIEGRWLCLTPQFVDAPDRFEFIPDPHLVWRDRGSSKVVYRHDQEIPDALRKNPTKHIRMRDEFRALVAEGHSAIKARDIVAKNNRLR